MKSIKYRSKLFIFLVSLIVVFISAILFCLSIYFSNNDKSATVVFSYSSNDLKLRIDNSSPITDELGKSIDIGDNHLKNASLKFSVSASMTGYEKIDYEIYAKEVNNLNSISSDYVKLYLTESNTNRSLGSTVNSGITTFNKLRTSAIDPGAKRIYRGTLKKNEVQDFAIRMWLADTYTVSNEKRTFQINLYVKVID